MTLVATALIVIAICQLGWLALAIRATASHRAFSKRVEPAIANLERISEHAARIAEQVEDMARVARQVEGRVAGTAGVVLDQIEPPIRTLAAVIAGVRAGVGKLFELNSNNHGQVRIPDPSGRD
jgi:hypothetical protein